MDTNDGALQDWIGRTETASDRITLDRCLAMQATLDQPDRPLGEDDPLPPLWHWLFFWTIVPRSGLGRDGHPALGGFLPPVGTARRMWAGSRVRFLQSLPIGEDATKTSTIKSVTEKSGRSGRLVFVTVRQEIASAAGLTIIDEHDIVYREDKGEGAAARPGTPAPAEAAYAREIRADPTMLFRYSALTFNGHRIHYDRDYATEVEGYAGLVVHGPLLATLMVDLAIRSWRDRPLRAFEFRGHRPIIDTETFQVAASPAGPDTLDLWIANSAGMLSMQGRAEFAG